MFAYFYKSVLSKKDYYLPVLVFTIISYGFSLLNRTISWDDMIHDFYFGSGNHCLSGGRWGMVFWVKVMGLLEVNPFVDRFLALLMFLAASVTICFLLYSICRLQDIMPYVVLSVFFLANPLINEIWEYCGANYFLTGGLLQMSLALVALRSDMPFLKKYTIASCLIVLPISSYEASVFYYVALVSIIIFYEFLTNTEKKFYFVVWMRKNTYYFIPIVIAFIIRISIAAILIAIHNLSYARNGATGTNWGSNDIGITLKSMLGHLFLDYGVNALIYLPISVFAVALVIFIIYCFSASFIQKRYVLLFLGLIVIVSLFTQSIIQGYTLPYRTAQTIILFVAFVAFLICEFMVNKKKSMRYTVYTLLFALCWYQAVYLNKILCLNNQRSENEASVVRSIGYSIKTNFEEKPVVFVAPYQTTDWIKTQITADPTTWNGRLFYALMDKIYPVEPPFKFIDTNVNCVTEQYEALQNVFSYFGYDIQVAGIPEAEGSENYYSKEAVLWREAKDIAKEKKMRPCQIIDNGNYLIVKLGEKYYLEDTENKQKQ